MGKKKEKPDPVLVLEAFFASIPADKEIFAGIDPGAEGAMGFLCGSKQAVIDIPVLEVKLPRKTRGGKNATKTVFDHPRILDVFRPIKAVKDRLRICLEQSQVQVKGKGSNALTGFRVGVSYGMWPLFLMSRSYSVTEVAPISWKKTMQLTGKDKEYARKAAISLWPKADIRLVKDHNRAEALLLAEHLRRQCGKH